MRRKRRKPLGSHGVFLIFQGGLLVFVLTFGMQMIREFSEGKALYQSVVSLDGLEWGEKLTAELQKIPGIRSLTPAIRIPVKLRAEDYTMEALPGCRNPVLARRRNLYDLQSGGNTCRDKRNETISSDRPGKEEL